VAGDPRDVPELISHLVARQRRRADLHQRLEVVEGLPELVLLLRRCPRRADVQRGGLELARVHLLERDSRRLERHRDLGRPELDRLAGGPLEKAPRQEEVLLTFGVGEAPAPAPEVGRC
jgi:hypothetical protein